MRCVSSFCFVARVLVLGVCSADVDVLVSLAAATAMGSSGSISGADDRK